MAELAGVSAVPMSWGYLYFGAVFKAGGRHLVINYFDHKRAALLEYDIAVKLSNFRQQTHRVEFFCFSNQEMPMNHTRHFQFWKS